MQNFNGCQTVAHYKIDGFIRIDSELIHMILYLLKKYQLFIM